VRIPCTVDRHFDTIANRESVTRGGGSLTSTSTRAVARHPDRPASGAMSPRPSHPSSNLGQCMRDNVTAGAV